jgi:hypothetical protein
MNRVRRGCRRRHSRTYTPGGPRHRDAAAPAVRVGDVSPAAPPRRSPRHVRVPPRRRRESATSPSRYPANSRQDNDARYADSVTALSVRCCSITTGTEDRGHSRSHTEPRRPRDRFPDPVAGGPAIAHRTSCGCLDRRRERATIACPLVEACQRPARPDGGEVPQAATGRSPKLRGPCL